MLGAPFVHYQKCQEDLGRYCCLWVSQGRLRVLKQAEPRNNPKLTRGAILVLLKVRLGGVLCGALSVLKTN